MLRDTNRIVRTLYGNKEYGFVHKLNTFPTCLITSTVLLLWSIFKQICLEPLKIDILSAAAKAQDDSEIRSFYW